MRSARRAGGAVGAMSPPSPIARLLSEDGQEPTHSITAAMALSRHSSGLQVRRRPLLTSPTARCRPGRRCRRRILGALTPHVSPSTNRGSSTRQPQEPYFKTRAAGLAGRGRPGDAAELLQLRRKASAMSADFAKLLGTHERTEAAVVDLRQ